MVTRPGHPLFGGVDEDGAVAVERLAEIVRRLGRAAHPDALQAVAFKLGPQTAERFAQISEYAPGHLVELVLESTAQVAAELKAEVLQTDLAEISRVPRSSREATRTLTLIARLLDEHPEVTDVLGDLLIELEQAEVLGEAIVTGVTQTLEQLDPETRYGAPPILALHEKVTYDTSALRRYTLSLDASTPQDVAHEVSEALARLWGRGATGAGLNLLLPAPVQRDTTSVRFGPYVSVTPEDTEAGLRVRGSFGRLPALFEG